MDLVARAVLASGSLLACVKVELGCCPEWVCSGDPLALLGRMLRPRILIVDDHAVMREGLRTLLGTLRPEWEICGEAADGRQAIESIKALKPDVVILDVTMPVISGLEAAARIRKLGLKCRIMMFTMHESKTVKAEIEKVGGHGYVRKSQPGRDLVAAIDGLLNGKAAGITKEPVW